MYNHLSPSYEEIHNACKEIADRIIAEEHQFVYVVGVARGGLLPAMILSHMLDLPLLLADYSSKDGRGDDKNHKNVLPEVYGMKGNLLVVDDICDSGKTMREIVDHFTSLHILCYTAVLYYKTINDPLIVPNFVWKSISHDSDWVIFPYERNEYLEPDFQAPTRHLQSLVSN